MAENIDLDQRVRILNRLKKHLLDQRDSFQSYLDLLDKEEDSIESGNLDSLRTQVELEKAIVEDIYAFQKVIDPMTELYRMAYPQSEPEIPALRSSLENVRKEVLARNERNRKLLRESIAAVRQEIASLRIPKHAKSPYGDVARPSMIDIQT